MEKTVSDKLYDLLDKEKNNKVEWNDNFKVFNEMDNIFLEYEHKTRFYKMNKW